MELTYVLEENDFLNHQLYLASKSERIKKNRLKRRLWVVVAFLSLAWIFYLKQDNVLFWYFVVVAVLAGLFYPFYLRRLYKRHYQKYIRENYINKIGKRIIMNINDERLWFKDELAEGNMSLLGLAEIIEVPTAFYLKMGVGESVLLPKGQLADISEVKNKLETIANQYNIQYQEELDWQWK